MTPVLNPDGIVRAEPYSKLRHVTLAPTVRVCITLVAQKPRQHYRIVGRISAVVVFGTCEHVLDIRSCESDEDDYQLSQQGFFHIWIGPVNSTMFEI